MTKKQSPSSVRPVTSFHHPDAETLQRVNRLWERMAFEVNLINHRISWLMTSQAFLIAAFIFLASQPENWNTLNRATLFLISILGFAICVIVSVLIDAATATTAACRNELLTIKNRYKRHFHDQVDTDSFVAEKGARSIRYQSRMLLLIKGFWVVLFVFTVIELFFLTPGEVSEILFHRV